MITGTTRLLGVLGHPVKHSLSPQIHNFTCQQLGIDQCYLPLDYQGHDLEALLQSFWDLGLVGINVTVPYKEQVAQLFPKLGFSAVNTLYRTSQSYWQCQSTDGIGFIRAASRICDFDNLDQVVILGNGGAAYSVAEAVRSYYPDLSIVMLRRSASKDAQIERLLGPKIQFAPFTPESLRDVISGSHGLLIQATSAPVFGHNLSQFSSCLKDFKGSYSDLVYGYDSSLFQEAKRLGIPHQDGLPMLIEQARESQLLWWGKALDYEQLLAYLSQKLKN